MKKSKQPRKQRKELYTMPLHRRRKQMSARLSKELKKKYGRRSFPVRKGDKVRVMSGRYKKKEGKVTGVSLKDYKIFVEKIVRTKAKGDEVPVPIHPSNVMIIEIDLSDPKRKKAIARKAKEPTQKIPVTKKLKIEKGEE